MASVFARSALTMGMGWGCALALRGAGTAVERCRPRPAGRAPADARPSTVPFKPEPPVRSYVAIRRLESDNQRHQQEAWLVVRTELKEDGAFTWQVLDEGGSEFIRNRVLRRGAREGGAGASRRPGPPRRPDRRQLHVLHADAGGRRGPRGHRARRREDMLVKGELLMSPEGELLRVEGDLVKRPSFWTKSVHLVRHYGRVDGTHVPVRLDMVAQVRIVGASRLSMTYQYLQINGRPVQDASRETSLLTRVGGGVRAAAPR